MKTDSLLQRAKELKLFGTISHWNEIQESHWLENLIIWEETERTNAVLSDGFRVRVSVVLNNWLILIGTGLKNVTVMPSNELMQLEFIKEITNVILCGPNGVGKSTIARNIAHQAVIRGFTVLFTTAGQMLNDLASRDGDNALRRRIKYYVQPTLLVIDEVGYLSYSQSPC